MNYKTRKIFSYTASLLSVVLILTLFVGCTDDVITDPVSVGTETSAENASKDSLNPDSDKENINENIETNTDNMTANNNQNENITNNGNDYIFNEVPDKSSVFNDRDYDSAIDTDCEYIDVTGKSEVIINSKGTYVLSGKMDNGSVIIDIEDGKKVHLVLDGTDITSKNSACILIKNSGKVYLTLKEGSKNILASESFAETSNPRIDGVIFSKSNLSINGTGSLIINSPLHGIVSKDKLKITSGTLKITSKKDALEGKDLIAVDGGDIEIKAGKKGLCSETEVYISDGIIQISECNEGIEGRKVFITGGNTDIISSDDGINASSPDDSEEDKDPFEADPECLISLSGGNINVNTSGDGIDSNGNLEVTGGNIYVSGPESGMNGSLDSSGECVICGGIVVAAGCLDMPENFSSSSTQPSILVNLKGNEGETITVSDSNGNIILSHAPSYDYECVVISHPSFIINETYTISNANETVTVKLESIIYGEGFSFH